MIEQRQSVKTFANLLKDELNSHFIGYINRSEGQYFLDVQEATFPKALSFIEFNTNIKKSVDLSDVYIGTAVMKQNDYIDYSVENDVLLLKDLPLTCLFTVYNTMLDYPELDEVRVAIESIIHIRPMIDNGLITFVFPDYF
tara:strand:+ start:4160 stop:4582 length:423 start_codon:yes stop_codon:yes gene_type:complete